MSKDDGTAVRVYQHMQKSNMDNFENFMTESAKESLNTLVYVDDPIGLGVFTNRVNQKCFFNSFVTGIKHYNASLLFSTQDVAGMSKTARGNIDVFIFMPDVKNRQSSFKLCPFTSNYTNFCKVMDKYTADSFNCVIVNLQFGQLGVYHMSASGTITSINSVPT